MIPYAVALATTIGMMTISMSSLLGFFRAKTHTGSSFLAPKRLLDYACTAALGGLGPYLGNYLGYQSTAELVAVTSCCVGATGAGYIGGNERYHYLFEPLFKKNERAEILKKIDHLMFESANGAGARKQAELEYAGFMRAVRKRHYGSPGIRDMAERALFTSRKNALTHHVLERSLSPGIFGTGLLSQPKEEGIAYVVNREKFMALDVTMIQNEQPHIIPEEPRNYKRRRLALQIAKNDDAWMLVAGTQSMEELTKRAIEE
ncbi:MAG: hypothetical protein QGG83_02745, partial [Candidatus Woesearchaeota archaeon]|nr:hypothetical protein [Candidatus Woesearchaeota archaeon]